MLPAGEPGKRAGACSSPVIMNFPMAQNFVIFSYRKPRCFEKMWHSTGLHIPREGHEIPSEKESASNDLHKLCQYILVFHQCQLRSLGLQIAIPAAC